MAGQLFPLERIVMTINLHYRLREAIPKSWADDLQRMITRYASGDRATWTKRINARIGYRCSGCKPPSQP